MPYNRITAQKQKKKHAEKGAFWKVDSRSISGYTEREGTKKLTN